jgi:hypothetical protein
MSAEDNVIKDKILCAGTKEGEVINSYGECVLAD